MSLKNAEARRLQLYKNKGNYQSNEVRRRREDVTVELRRQKREESLAKKRNMSTNEGQTMDSVASENDQVQNNLAIVEFNQTKDDLIRKMMSQWPKEQLEAVSSFRKFLSKGKTPPIQEVISCGVVPKLVDFLMCDGEPSIQFEAAWALTNIASGTSEQTKCVVENGGIPKFVRLLRSPNPDVKEQAIWALGNISGDGPEYRDLVISEGTISPLLEIFNDPNNRLSTLRNGSWTLSNICRGKTPCPNWDDISNVIGTLARLIYSSDEELISDTCWALSYLSDGSNDRIQQVIDASVCGRLVELLSHPSNGVKIPALRTIGNIVTGDDCQTQIIIDAGSLPALYKILQSDKVNIRKECCWAISNITAGTPLQIQSVIDAGIIPVLVDILKNGDYRSKKEACWAISNATSGGIAVPGQVHHIVNCNALKPFVSLLSSADSRIVRIVLDGIENILRVGEMERPENNGINRMAVLIDEAKGTEAIFSLQFHDDIEIYTKAFELIDGYFKENVPDVVDFHNSNQNDNNDTLSLKPSNVYNSMPTDGFQFT